MAKPGHAAQMILKMTSNPQVCHLETDFSTGKCLVLKEILATGVSVTGGGFPSDDYWIVQPDGAASPVSAQMNYSNDPVGRQGLVLPLSVEAGSTRMHIVYAVPDMLHLWGSSTTRDLGFKVFTPSGALASFTTLLLKFDILTMDVDNKSTATYY